MPLHFLQRAGLPQNPLPRERWGCKNRGVANGSMNEELSSTPSTISTVGESLVFNSVDHKLSLLCFTVSHRSRVAMKRSPRALSHARSN
jgi:hypothetical protein